MSHKNRQRNVDLDAARDLANNVPVRGIRRPTPAAPSDAEIIAVFDARDGIMEGIEQMALRFARRVLALSQTTQPQALVPSDSDMVNAAYCLHKYRQGTDNGIAFNRGARWMLAALKTASPQAGTEYDPTYDG